MPTPQAYHRLAAEHEELKRAAFWFCMNTPTPTEGQAASDHQVLWDLCGDWEPSETDQGLIPIPDGYNEQ